MNATTRVTAWAITAGMAVNCTIAHRSGSRITASAALKAKDCVKRCQKAFPSCRRSLKTRYSCRKKFPTMVRTAEIAAATR